MQDKLIHMIKESAELELRLISEAISHNFTELNKRLDKMSEDFDASVGILNDKIDALGAVDKKMEDLLGTLANQIRASAGEPAKLMALADKVDVIAAAANAAIDAATAQETSATPPIVEPVVTQPSESAPADSTSQESISAPAPDAGVETQPGTDSISS